MLGGVEWHNSFNANCELAITAGFFNAVYILGVFLASPFRCIFVHYGGHSTCIQ